MPPITRFRISMAVFIFGLIVSGVTAFPLLAELRLLNRMVSHTDGDRVGDWVYLVYHGLESTYASYPWIAYGTDWLAFGHLIIALFFIGPFRDPHSSKGNIIAGIVACLAVIPLAMICGSIRGIPIFWRLIDCSFGIIGLIPLIYCLRLLPKIEARS